MGRLVEWLCRHREWEPVAPVWSEDDNGAIHITWSAMECLGCHKVRWDNVLKPGESVSLDIGPLHEG